MADNPKTPEPDMKLDDAAIKTVRQRGRRSFLRSLGISLAGAAALAVSRSSPAAARDDDPTDGRDSDSNDNTPPHHDFPKVTSNDGDVSTMHDIKSSDSDGNDGEQGDGDVTQLRDLKGSTDSD